jgi:hypothetical protein
MDQPSGRFGSSVPEQHTDMIRTLLAAMRDWRSPPSGGTGSALSQLIAMVVAMTFNFMLNSANTFRDRQLKGGVSKRPADFLRVRA